MRDDRALPPRDHVRTCVGCRVRIGADEASSFGVVLGLADPSGRHELAVDLAGGSFGRGAHVHANAACLAKACAGGFSHAFRSKISSDEAAVRASVALASKRRIEGLLLGARRAGLLTFGEDARRAVSEGARLIVVARDAGASALGGPLRDAVAEGRVVAWGTKVELGLIFSREVVAIVAVRHESVAREIRRAARLAESVAEAVTGS